MAQGTWHHPNVSLFLETLSVAKERAKIKAILKSWHGLFFSGIYSHNFCWTYSKENLVGLEFNSPVNTVRVMLSWSVYLTTLFLGRLSPLSGYQYLCISGRERMTIENIS